MRSLWLKLTLTFVAVALAAVGLVAILANRTVTSQFDVYVAHGRQMQAGRGLCWVGDGDETERRKGQDDGQSPKDTGNSEVVRAEFEAVRTFHRYASLDWGSLARRGGKGRTRAGRTAAQSGPKASFLSVSVTGKLVIPAVFSVCTRRHGTMLAASGRSVQVGPRRYLCLAPGTCRL